MKDIKNAKDSSWNETTSDPSSHNSWGATASDPSSPNYREIEKNKAIQDSPYGKYEPSVHTTHK